VSAPTPPFHKLTFRWSARVGKFFPCADTDPRGSMVDTVDATGHVVIADYAGNTFAGGQMRLIGYKLGHPSSMYDPADGLKWLTAEKSRRRNDRLKSTRPTT
jgi:hypothetical protein